MRLFNRIKSFVGVIIWFLIWRSCLWSLMQDWRHESSEVLVTDGEQPYGIGGLIPSSSTHVTCQSDTERWVRSAAGSSATGVWVSLFTIYRGRVDVRQEPAEHIGPVADRTHSKHVLSMLSTDQKHIDSMLRFLLLIEEQAQPLGPVTGRLVEASPDQVTFTSASI